MPAASRLELEALFRAGLRETRAASFLSAEEQGRVGGAPLEELVALAVAANQRRLLAVRAVRFSA